MQNALTNWKTTAAAGALVLLSIGHLFGIDIPGFTAPDLGTSLAAALGLWFAKDATAK